MTATATGTGEFERFGPWIDEVRTLDEVPRLFRSFPLDLADARLVLKVPRSIPRREATAEMDLYDHLLVLDASGLTVLSRDTTHDRPQRRPRAAGAVVPGSFEVRTLPYGDIAGVRDAVSLLDASLTIHPRSGDALTITYNGSARASVQRLVGAIRTAITADVTGAAGQVLLAVGSRWAVDPEDVALPDDLALVSNLRELRRGRPTLTAWAWHGRRRVSRWSSGLGVASRVADAVAPVTLSGAILASDLVTLEVLGRRDPLVRGAVPDHSAAHVVVALGAIDRVEIARHDNYDDVVIATLVAGAARLDLELPDGSAAHHLLNEAVAPTV